MPLNKCVKLIQRPNRLVLKEIFMIARRSRHYGTMRFARRMEIKKIHASRDFLNKMSSRIFGEEFEISPDQNSVPMFRGTSQD